MLLFPSDVTCLIDRRLSSLGVFLQNLKIQGKMFYLRFPVNYYNVYLQ